ncbi:hypothetical protein DNI29_17740 [Hymenobacter sediminis]|uniref:hypothetical protein n=1 Tax=Hymenobacter sediminis TaxID=2218621 RepID=UPI000DA6C0CE|nr:hypothetical protein [Hymenobacter sediminis]RPD45235.1 hypothetical protein DNI29_17740 [Hymenobacter sediminis]
MTKPLLFGGTLALAGLTLPAYKTYRNQCFCYRIDYLANFKPQPETENGDGREFVSPDELTTLSASAEPLMSL